ncbi:class I SAM-dependent methyltransferase [Sphingomonas soli]|uniref:class I SAM-dependent methyltransferase n=1 Tax=Sphingomonas soli TaxID=266127 RepID=UPI00082B14F9|nr:class I SAM-dependent methyltransferase [Sphingomonas soli]
MKLLAAATLLAFASPAAHAQSVPPAITAALADPARPADQRARDAARHPGEVLAFAGIKPGDKVADFLMGGGYWTRILSPLVGPKGHVYAYEAAEFIAYRKEYATEQDEAVKGYANVTAVRTGLGSVAFAEPLDAIVTIQNYHDLHLKASPPGAAAYIAGRLYAALKPGGVLVLVDHAANTDPGFAAPDTLHRIDPAATRKELEGVGFKFEGESAVLRNPADPRTANVFTPEIRGKTDQFFHLYRKPG